MRYHYRERVKIKKSGSKKKFVTLPLFGLIAGVYLATTAFSPMLGAVPGIGSEEMRRKLAAAPNEIENRLYIPKINVNQPILTGTAAVLASGSWHHKAELGNPKRGGNFTVCALGFSMGWTPGQTQAQSPFYNLDKLTVGDKIFVDYDGQRYGYEVEERLSSDATQTNSANSSDDDVLTLSACTPSGVDKNSKVYVASSLGRVQQLTIGSN